MDAFCVAALAPLNVSHPATHEEPAMFNKALVTAIIAFGFCTPIIAEDAAPDTAGGRYSLNQVADGFVRLDTQTGAIELCSQRTVGWACQTAPEDRTAFEDEIEHLQSENAALKKALLSHGLPLPDEMMSEAPGTDSNQITIRLPDNADINRAIAYVGQVWQRFVDAVSKAHKQILNKT
jgi:hypothetical protein